MTIDDKSTREIFEAERPDECERDGGHVYVVTPQGIGPCAFCGKKAEEGDTGHLIKN